MESQQVALVPVVLVVQVALGQVGQGQAVDLQPRPR
jgi:hypothetical protein